MPDRDLTVCVVGTGHIGLPLAAVLADAGFRVTGYDVNDEFLTRVTTTGRAGYIEEGLDDLLARTLRGRLTLSSTPPAAHDVYIITVGTPLDPATGRPTIDKVRQAIAQLAPRFGPDPLVILRSTVTIGTSRGVVLPEMAKHAARFGLAFCPERTIEGKAIAEMKSLPQIVGGVDERSADRAEALFRAITDKIVRVSSLEAAEMIKLMNNTYRDLTFAFANEMALMAERLGLTAAELIGAANLDYARSSIARPGFVGGPCLEKDALILIDSLGRLDFRLGVVQAARETNAALPDQVAGRLLAEIAALGRGPAGARVVISGFAFKGAPATEDVRGSAAMPIMQRLLAAGVEVWGHDFVTPEKVIADLGARACSLEEGCVGADALLVMNNHAGYGRVDVPAISRSMRAPALVFDSWNLFAAERFASGPAVRYGAIGTPFTWRGAPPPGAERPGA